MKNNTVVSSPLKIIVSGGGTGGHLFPAIAIANECKKQYPSAEILFVGAEGKMEAEKVPSAGYPIALLDIVGIQRKLTLKNIQVPIKLWKSFRKAIKIVEDFQPSIIIGVGGYASAPVLFAGIWKKIPTLIQEQNSYAGITNKLLGKKVDKICVAYPDMENFFPAQKIVYTGNPVRANILRTPKKLQEAYTYFGLDATKFTIVVIGGSLGALTINQSITNILPWAVANNIQILWQTGKHFYAQAQAIQQQYALGSIKVFDFIAQMDYAYSVADIVVSRAGAMSISELSALHKPAVFIPSPNVSEDHQTKNAMALVTKDAAVYISDSMAVEELGSVLKDMYEHPDKLKNLEQNIQQFAVTDATQRIVEVIKSMV